MTRTRELSIRVALGAARPRMLRQVLTESGVLALCAGAIGLALAPAVLRATASAIPADIYPVGRIVLHPTAVAVHPRRVRPDDVLSGWSPDLAASRVTMAVVVVLGADSAPA